MESDRLAYIRALKKLSDSELERELRPRDYMPDFRAEILEEMERRKGLGRGRPRLKRLKARAASV